MSTRTFWICFLILTAVYAFAKRAWADGEFDAIDLNEAQVTAAVFNCHDEDADCDFVIDPLNQWRTAPEVLTVTDSDGHLFAAIDDANKVIRVLSTSEWRVEYVGSEDELDQKVEEK